MTIRHPRIDIDPNIMSGQPVVAGTRVPVSVLLHVLSQGVSREEVLENYPGVTEEDLQAILRFTAEMMERFIYDRAA